MQRGPPVAARGGLPVPLFDLLDSVVRGVPVLVCGLAVERACEPVGGLAVPALSGGTHPLPGTGVPAVLQEVGERVRAQHMPLLGGLAQPVLGGGLVPALAVVPAERVRGGGRAGDGGDPPPAGGLLGVAALVQEDAQIVGGGPVPGRGGGTQLGLGSVEVAAAQQHGSEDAHRLGVAGLRGDPEAHLLGGFPHVAHLVPRRLLTRRLHKSPCLEQSCLVPHNVHRRTTCNLGTPGIPQPVRSLQRFVDMPTER